jgi:uncharacterized protein (TIGR02996 family)
VSEDVEQTFIEAIRKNPDDEEARAVYADWLDQRGDPRGEYLRLESILVRAPTRMADLIATIDPGWLESVSRKYDVALGNTGSNKILVIKNIRELTGLGLKDSKDIVDKASDATPHVVRSGIDRLEAEAAVAKLASAGATVRAVPHKTDARVVLAVPPLAPGVTVILAAVSPDRRLDAIHVLRQITLLGLRDARDVVDRVTAGTPCPILKDVDRKRVPDIMRAFGAAATIEIEPATKPLV